MNWIVSDKALTSADELTNRAKIIQEIVCAKVSPWRKHSCKGTGLFQPPVNFYQCTSKKGEYGFFITAHINIEVQPILLHVLTSKKALVVINSCAMSEATKVQCLNIVKSKNANSELYFAKQILDEEGHALNYYDNVGAFGFATTISERELFQNRNLGLTKALRTVFEKVVKKQ